MRDHYAFELTMVAARVSGENRDLMMPDFSFAPFSYLTNTLDANMSANAAVPRGWPAERHAIYSAGRRLSWDLKRRALFWRGGQTNEQRRVYTNAIVHGNVTLPTDVHTDVHLCGAHCSLSDGVPPEAWCDNQILLSLPGASFAVGFKYTLLCSSLVVRGAHSPRESGSCAAAKSCPRIYEQFWHAGLSADEHFVTSRTVADLPRAVKQALRAPQTPVVATRSADYAYHVLDPQFISEYWHALLTGYAGLFDWPSTDSGPSATADMCSRPHRQAPYNSAERTCFRGLRDTCTHTLIGEGQHDFVPLPSPSEIAVECSTTEGLQRLYRRFTRVLPYRFLDGSNVSEATREALWRWKRGDNQRHRVQPQPPSKSG